MKWKWIHSRDDQVICVCVCVKETTESLFKPEEWGKFWLHSILPFSSNLTGRQTPASGLPLHWSVGACVTMPPPITSKWGGTRAVASRAGRLVGAMATWCAITKPRRLRVLTAGTWFPIYSNSQSSPECWGLSSPHLTDEKTEAHGLLGE